jgi:hypothetical protein
VRVATNCSFKHQKYKNSNDDQHYAIKQSNTTTQSITIEMNHNNLAVDTPVVYARYRAIRWTNVEQYLATLANTVQTNNISAIRQQLVNGVKYDVDLMTEQEQTKEVNRINSFTEFEVKSVAKRRTKMYLASLEKYDSGYQSSYNGIYKSIESVTNCFHASHDKRKSPVVTTIEDEDVFSSMMKFCKAGTLKSSPNGRKSLYELRDSFEFWMLFRRAPPKKFNQKNSNIVSISTAPFYIYQHEKKGVIEGVSAQFRTVVRSANTGEDIGTLKKAYNATSYVEQKNKKEYRSAGISKQKKTHPKKRVVTQYDVDELSTFTQILLRKLPQQAAIIRRSLLDIVHAVGPVDFQIEPWMIDEQISAPAAASPTLFIESLEQSKESSSSQVEQFVFENDEWLLDASVQEIIRTSGTKRPEVLPISVAPVVPPGSVVPSPVVNLIDDDPIMIDDDGVVEVSEADYLFDLDLN